MHFLSHFRIGFLLFLIAVQPASTHALGRFVEVAPEVRVTSHTLAQRRIAVRMQRRIENRFQYRVSLESAMNAVQLRQVLMRRMAHVQFISPESGTNLLQAEWLASASDHPLWIEFSVSKKGVNFAIHEDAIRLSIEAGEPADFPRPRNAVLRNVHQDRRVLRGEDMGETQSGYVFDAEELSGRIAQSLRGHTDDVIQIAATFTQPQLFVIGEDGSTNALTQLSVGKSEFSGSPWGRIQNIRTALLSQMNGVVIPAGEEFSFNDALVGNPGWESALVIKNGKDLVYEPGGGICQASTTVYRSMLLAGLPVMERKSHSLYVHYYKEYGVGVDATVYFGKQDLVIHNDTPGDLVMLADIDDTEATVKLFGISDGRTVDIQGPYFAQTAPSDLLIHGRALRKSEIAWTQSVTYKSGYKKNDVILSQYNSVPQKLYLEYPVSRGIAELEGTYTATEESDEALVVLGGDT